MMTAHNKYLEFGIRYTNPIRLIYLEQTTSIGGISFYLLSGTGNVVIV